jgi:hypothetical protein
MTVLWQIFDTLAEIEEKNNNINVLFGYPNPETKTERYRESIKHPTLDLWRGCVEDNLIEKCASMTAEEKLNYYDSSDLKDQQWLEENGWIESEE